MNINVYDLYKTIKYEPSFRSLSMSEKLHMLERVSGVIQKYTDAGFSDKVALITGEFLVDHISTKGFRRTSRILIMCDDMETKLREFQLDKDGAELNFKKTWKKNIFHV